MGTLAGSGKEGVVVCGLSSAAGVSFSDRSVTYCSVIFKFCLRDGVRCPPERPGR